MNNKEKIKNTFDSLAENKKYLSSRKNYYNRQVRRLYRFLIPENSSILELGSGSGMLLDCLRPRCGVGVDISGEMVKEAQGRYKGLKFIENDTESMCGLNEKFDYIIASDLVGHLDDLYRQIKNIKQFCDGESRVIFSFYNNLWEPVIKLAELLRIKIPVGFQNWVTLNDMENLFEISGFKVINKDKVLLFPLYIPVVSSFLNRIIAKLPLIKNFCLVNYIIARKMPEEKKEFTSSIIVPCLDEKGNIENIIKRIPEFGKGIEIIFIDGRSTDGTIEEIKRIIDKYTDKKIILIHQGGPFGKNDAVRKGFSAASGEVLFIQDSDITVDPETLPEFYEIISSGKGEFINGSRLVYPLEKDSMRFLNILGNMFFSIVFSFLLNQKIKDTLCGTKVISKNNWKKLDANRKYFGEFDPFGDFDLLFGASKLNLDIVELPVRYRARTYGDIKIRRFRHGLLLLKMAVIALFKLKIKL